MSEIRWIRVWRHVIDLSPYGCLASVQIGSIGIRLGRKPISHRGWQRRFFMRRAK